MTEIAMQAMASPTINHIGAALRRACRTDNGCSRAVSVAAESLCRAMFHPA
jgi:hypothetical protein